MASILKLFQKDNEPADEESLVALVQKRLKNAEPVLQEYHREWFQLVAMRAGLQYVQSRPGSGIVMNPSEDAGRVRMIMNRMTGIHQTRVAKIIKDLPNPIVVPASSQDEDKDLARNGTKLLSWLWQNERMIDKIMEVASWMVDIGDCFLYVYWDFSKGTEIPTFKRHEGDITEDMPYQVDEEGFILDDNGQRIEDDLKTGDVAVDIYDSFSVVNDGSSTSVQDSSWIGIRKTMSLSDIEMKWPERGGEVKEDADSSERTNYQRRLMALIGGQSGAYSPESKFGVPSAEVQMMFERASEKYPKGRSMVVAGGVLLEAGDMPFDHGLYPLIKFSDIQLSGSFWSNSTMGDIAPVQKGFNRVWSQIVENGNNFGNIKAWVEKGHGLTSESYNDTGTEILEVNAGKSVNQLQPAELPSHVVNQLGWYDKAFEDISGQHEVSQGKAPGGIKSGRAIIALQEQDDTRLAPTKIRFYRGIEELGYMALMLYAQFQEEDREYQIVGSDSYDIDNFKISKDDIRSMKKDVRVQTENIIAAHKRLQQEEIHDYWNDGLFGPKDDPEVRKKVLQLLEFGNVNELFDEINMDEAQAERENEQFINSKGLHLLPNPEFDQNAPPGLSPQMVLSVPAYEFEDHLTHIAKHNKLRKSPRYRQMSDKMKKGLDLHVKVHQNFLNKPVPKPVGPSVGPLPPPPGAIPPPRVPGMPPLPPPPAPVGPPPTVPPMMVPK